MKRLLFAALAIVGLAGVLAWPDMSSAEARKQHVSAAPGLTTVPLYSSQARDKVLRQVPAASINGDYDVTSSSASAIAIRLGKEQVWLDTFDVIVSNPGGKQTAKEECIVLAKKLPSQQSSQGLDTATCSKSPSR